MNSLTVRDKLIAIGILRKLSNKSALTVQSATTLLNEHLKTHPTYSSTNSINLCVSNSYISITNSVGARDCTVDSG